MLQQLGCAPSEPDAALPCVVARAHDQQVSVLEANHVAQPAPLERVGLHLDAGPGASASRVSNSSSHACSWRLFQSNPFCIA